MIVQADLKNLPFAPGSIGSAQYNHCLEHMNSPDSQLAVNEMSRVMKNGAEAELSVPHHIYESMLTRVDPKEMSSKMHLQELSLIGLGDLVENNGLKITESKTQNSKQALLQIGIAILHRIRPDIISRSDQIGYKLENKGKPEQTKLKAMAKVFKKIIDFVLPLTDRIIPYENVVVATKM